MLTLDFQTLQGFFQTNWGWAAGLAGAMVGLTMLAGALLNPARKDSIALWLMGAETEENWAKSFTALFDAVFGARHLSLRCLIRSAIASLIAVVVIWALLGNFGALGLRMQADLSLGSVLVIALAVNVAADYVSLLETRWLLGVIGRLRSVPAQIGLLILDLVISAAIIWLAIVLYLASPLHQGEAESFAEILGLFSIFSVFFYSTFLTSVWSWAYILSVWILRLFKRLKLADWLDIEGKPVRILALTLGLVVFLGALAVAVPMRKDASGLTLADKALCSVFKGPVCLDVAALTEEEAAKFEFFRTACESGLTAECYGRALQTFDAAPGEAIQLWSIACNSGDPASCSGLGILLAYGHGGTPDPSAALEPLTKGCDGEDELGCATLGVLYAEGLGVAQDYAQAAEYFWKGCNWDHTLSCANLGALYESGSGVAQDLVEAGRLYQMACDAGDAKGCSNLGFLYDEGQGVGMDDAEAARLYVLGCEGGQTMSCNNLGVLYGKGDGVEQDLAEAARLYGLSCQGGNALGCTNLGYLYSQGDGVALDIPEALRLYQLGCEGGNALGCTNIGHLHHEGLLAEASPEKALEFFRRGCEMGEESGCDWARQVGGE